MNIAFYAEQLLTLHCFSGGTENKDLAVRKIRNRIGYWEIRCADFTANMYLVLGAWITAGSLGVREKSQLWWKDLQSE